MIRVAIAAAAEDAAWVRRELTSSSAFALQDSASGAAVIISSAAQASVVLDRAGATPVVVIGELGHVDPRAAYVARHGLPGEVLAQLLEALVGRPAPTPALEPARNAEEARGAQRAFTASRKLAAAGSLAETEALAIDALLELMSAERAQCLFCDDEWALWSQAQLDSRGDERRAVAGLTGFAARTHRQVVVERAGADLRWVAALDDPPGDGSERVAVQPVVSSSGEVHGVLVVSRGGRRTPFSIAELATFERFAQLLSPFLDQMSVHASEQSLIVDESADGMFRTEAMLAQEAPQRGALVRLSPRWVGWTYYLVIGLLVAFAVFVTLAKVSTYSTGPALLRASAKLELVTRTSGNVSRLEVDIGDAVEVGTIVARLDDGPQRAALARAEREFAAELRNHMLEPADAGAESAVRQRRQELHAARAALEERLVRSPGRGVVTEVRARPGQRVEPGDLVAAMVDGESPLEVIALLPGSDRPQLAAGMTMRVEISGYRYAYQSLLIDSVSADVLGPAEARRVLGPQVKESVSLGGPVVLVRGRLAGAEVAIDGERYRLHDGMVGTAMVQVRSERVLFALIPGLRRL